MKISSFQSTGSSGAASGSSTGFGSGSGASRSFNLRNLSKLMLPPLGSNLSQSTSGSDKWVVSPLDSRYRCWETFMVILVAYSAWVYPFEVAFMDASPKGGLEVADMVVDIFFAVDIVLTFYVAYIDSRTQLLVRDRKRITFRYLSTFFIMDVASTIPYQGIAYLVNGEVMGCPFCRAPGGPCSSFDSCASVFTVVLDHRCSRRVYVPCSVRSHLARYIEECRVLAIRRGDRDIDLALHNSEGNLYHVLYTHGRVSSKFHGPSWEELVNDYGLRHRDMMTVRLEHYGTWCSVDFHRDDVMLFPLPFVALEDLSETQRELVESCFYSRGIFGLNYHQMFVMSRQLFDDNYILCTPFVHRIDSMNVNGQHMVIPPLVVSSLKEFLSIPTTGSLTLEITLDSEDDDISVSIPCSYFIGLGGTMVLNKEGFGNFLLASSMEVNNLVLITFKERDQELVVVFSHLPQ